MSQQVIVYGPVERPVVYTTAAGDIDAARLQAWECQQRHPTEKVRITTADAVPLPTTSD